MDRYRVEPGSDVDLSQWDPEATATYDGSKRDARKRLEKLVEELAELQERLWAEDKHKLLIVIQAMDTGGKDGAIRRVFTGINPQGVRVANFKAPSKEELAHDYLWRVHAEVPEKGEIVIFNRSHYEDVLIVRVLGLAPEEVWSRRYDHINDFERMLTEEGTVIIKFYLHISKEEQRERLQARLDEPDKNWKFNTGDLDHRKLWDDYMAAFEAALSKTSTANAPWYIVPANKKWYRDLVMVQTIVDTLEALNMQYPDAEEGLDGVIVE
jgi:PPK2 family polyphosphate:nucleotide phosphotransferase